MLSANTAAVVRGGRWIATVSRLSSIAPETVSEKVNSTISTRASPTGQRRRTHTPGPPPRGGGQRAARPPRRGPPPPPADDQEPEDDRDQEHQAVNDPVAPSAPG